MSVSVVRLELGSQGFPFPFELTRQLDLRLRYLTLLGGDFLGSRSLLLFKLAAFLQHFTGALAGFLQQRLHPALDFLCQILAPEQVFRLTDNALQTLQTGLQITAHTVVL